MILALFSLAFGVDLDPLDPAGSLATGVGGLATEGAQVPAEGIFGALHLSYAKDLAVLRQFDGGERPGLAHALTATAQVGWSFRDVGRVELMVPVSPWLDAPGSQFSGPALGDIALNGYLRVFRAGPAFTLGVSPRFNLPTAPKASPVSGGVGGRALLVAGGEVGVGSAAVPPAIGWAANVGASFAATQPYYTVDLGTALEASGAAWMRLGGGRVGLEAQVRAGVASDRSDTAAVGHLFGQYTLENGLAFHGAVGTGLVSGVGAPAVRAVVGVAWTSPTRDGDRDGLPDRADACERAPEDLDGFEDADGCPELDDDLDGLRDVNDKCPREPEDRDGTADEDGCPDPDDDADGILDVADACPLVPGLVRGCPDADGDGVPDHEDECRDLAGSPTTAGCPDTDGDGLTDLRDKCPKQAGDPPYGCPAQGAAADEAAEVQPADVLERLYFESGSSLLPRDAEPALSTVLAYLAANPDVRLVEIAGHTDNQGNAVDNACLAQARADAAWRWLVDRGVAPARLTARGYSANEPRDTNMTEAGRRHNRRVEFRIRERGPEPEVPCGTARR